MKEDLFHKLPSGIIVDILSRLPVQTVAFCKCVCKSWLRLLETNEFVKTHLSKSVPGLLVPDYRARRFRDYRVPPYKYLLFDDVDDGVHYLQSHQVNKPVAVFNIPRYKIIHGSSDGLLFLRTRSGHDICICNPVTHDCIELQYPQELVDSHLSVAYGFGRSKITGQHKVVAIREKLSKLECRVYTLGTGSWRTIAPGPTFKYSTTVPRPTFVNGNLHWLVYDSNDIPWVSCFDLETELFTTFSTPILRDGGGYFDVYASGNCLCLYQHKNLEHMIRYGIWDANEDLIWVMKDYGDVNSWTKEFIDISGQYTLMNPLLYTPSFLSLKSFVGENVCSF